MPYILVVLVDGGARELKGKFCKQADLLLTVLWLFLALLQPPPSTHSTFSLSLLMSLTVQVLPLSQYFTEGRLFIIIGKATGSEHPTRFVSMFIKMHEHLHFRRCIGETAVSKCNSS